MNFLGWLFDDDDSNKPAFSHHGCSGHLEEVFGTNGYQIFQCSRCGRKFKDRGQGLIVRQREE